MPNLKTPMNSPLVYADLQPSDVGEPADAVREIDGEPPQDSGGSARAVPEESDQLRRQLREMALRSWL